MARLEKYLYYNVDNDKLETSNSSGTTVTQNPNLFIDNEYVIKMELLSNSTGYDVSDIVEWDAYYGNIGDSLVNVANASFNVAGDWTEQDASIGKISLRLDLNANVSSDIGTTAIKTHRLQVVGNDSSNTRTIALAKISTYNTVVTI